MSENPTDPLNWPATARFDAGSEMMKWLLDEAALGAGGVMAKVNGLHDQFDRLQRCAWEMRIEAGWCQNEDF